MNLSAFFIRRPAATILLMLGLLLAGVMAYQRLPMADLPSIDFPTITVTAAMPGASAQTMAASVATPLEKRLSAISGLDSITSVNSLGSTRITLQFSLERDIDAAAQDAQTAISSAQRSLPRDLPNPPTMNKVNPADSPIFFIALSSDTLRASDVSEYAENFLAQRLSMLRGVAQVSVYGSQKYAVRVQADPELMAAMNIGIDEVAAAISNSNSSLPVGVLSGGRREYTLHSSGKLMRAAEFRPLIVAWRDGAPLRLEDVALVHDGVENDRRRSWYNGKPAMLLAVQRQPGANTVQVADGIKALLPELRAQIPPAVNMDTLFDRSESIRESVRDVKLTMLLTIVLVILVIFLFLRDARATLIPALAVPLSMLGACAVMYLCGFSLNNISLMALTLSVGFVVDDAIVMLENIVRHREQGKEPLQAALDGSREIGFTILSMTISLVSVFIPVFFLGGLVGRLFHEFAVSIAAAIMVSGLVALTLTPMLCGRFLSKESFQGAKKPAASGHPGRLGRVEHAFSAALELYRRSLASVMRRKGQALAGSFALMLITALMFAGSPKGFLPFEDTGVINISCEILQGSSFERAAAYAGEVEAIARREKHALSYITTVGPAGPQSSMNIFTGQLRIRNKAERAEDIQEVMGRLRRNLAAVPGVRAFVSQPPPIRLGASSRALYQVTLQSPDTQGMYRASEFFMRKMAELPGVIDINSDLQMRNPELKVNIDRAKCAALGLTPSQVEEALAYAYGTRTVSTILAPSNDYAVILELKPEFRGDINALNYLHVRSGAGRLVPLRTAISTSTGLGPLSVNHSGQMNSVTISFNLASGHSIGPTLEAVEKLAALELPDDVSVRFQGTAQAFQDSLGNIRLLLFMAVAVIYIVLGMLYESFIHPVTILSGLPAAAVGALATLLLWGRDLDLYGFVGIIMLIGIVKKNAIMMVDFALEGRKGGLDTEQAILRGALARFRPIMMTTLAALMGGLPIAAGWGAGGEARQPLGLAVVGGLLVSQLLTLYLTPVYFVYLDRLQNFLTRRIAGKNAG